MDFTIFIITLFALQIVCLIAGMYSSKKMKSQEDYFLAGKGLKFFPLTMTFIATQIGGGTVLGAAEEAYVYGWSVLFYPLGCALGLVLLASGIGKKMAEFNVSTIAQLFEVVYRSPKLKQIASLLSIISLFMILVGQIIASKKFITSLGVESVEIFIAFWGIVILYTSWGGFKAVVMTDVIQAVFFIAVFIICFAYVFLTCEFSLYETALMGSEISNPDIGQSKLCGWLILPLLFMVIEQDMGQRCFAAQSPKTVSTASACAAVSIILICFIPVFLGVLGKNLGIEISEGSSVLMTVINSLTSPVLSALIGCAILAAIISTADSLISAITSNLSQDFNLSIFKKEKSVLSSQVTTAVIASFGIICSYYFNNIVDILIQSYELSVSCLFIPVFAALFKKRGNFSSALMSILAGAAAYCFFKFYSTEFPKEIMSIIVSFFGYLAGELFVKLDEIPQKA